MPVRCKISKWDTFCALLFVALMTWGGYGSGGWRGGLAVIAAFILLYIGFAAYGILLNRHIIPGCSKLWQALRKKR